MWLKHVVEVGVSLLSHLDVSALLCSSPYSSFSLRASIVEELENRKEK